MYQLAHGTPSPAPDAERDDPGALHVDVSAAYRASTGVRADVRASRRRAARRGLLQQGQRPRPGHGRASGRTVAGYRLRILDGNHLVATKRRLEALWQVSAGPLPGMALMVFDYVAMMMSDVLLARTDTPRSDP